MNFLLGLAAGVFGGLVGLGGGVIMIPLMVDVLKMEQHEAHGTSLVAIVCTGISGAIIYAMKGSVNIPASVLLASSAILTARYGAHFANNLPEWKLKKAFGYFLVLVLLLLLLKPCISYVAEPASVWLTIIILLLTGSFTGFLSGMMGVGGGMIMVPSMVLFTGFTQYTAQGSSLLAMIPVAGVGAFTHWNFGNINTSILPGFIPGIVIGTFLGGFFASTLPEGVLRIIFAAVLTWTGIKYLRTPTTI